MPRSQLDRNLHVEFYEGTVLDGPASEEAGHPVHMSHPFIRIHVPGDPNTVIDTSVNDYYRNRFPDEYRRFMSGMESGIAGWSLKEWPVIGAAHVKNLEYLNIHTVEQLAGLTDAQVQKVGMGGIDLRTKAKAALEAAKDGAALSAQAAKNQQLEDELAALKAQLNSLSDAAEPRGPGRPRKEKSEA